MPVSWNEGDVLTAQGKKAEARTAQVGARINGRQTIRPAANCCNRSSTAWVRPPDVTPPRRPVHAAGLLLSGCATISGRAGCNQSVRQFGPKMAVLAADQTDGGCPHGGSVGIAKAGDYPLPWRWSAIRLCRGAKGTLSRIEDGKTIWKIDAGQALSAGVGANAANWSSLVRQGVILAFSATMARLWKAGCRAKCWLPRLWVMTVLR